MATYFNHNLYPRDDQTPDMQADLRQNGTVYAMRSIVLTNPGDILPVDPKLYRHYDFLRGHLSEAGIETTDEIITDTSRESILDYDGLDADFYHFDEEWNQLRPDPERYEATKLIGDKNQFVEHFIELGMGRYMPATHIVEPDRRIGEELNPPVFIKAPAGSNGTDVDLIKTPEALTAAIEHVGSRYQLQQPVENIVASVSKNYFISQNGAFEPVVVSQTHVKKNYAHGGNTYPASVDPSEVTDRFAAEAARLGVRGYCGFDTLVANKAGHATPLVIEGNPRYTWVTYSKILTAKLGLDENNSWSAYPMPTKLKDPRAIDLGSLGYDRHSQEGVIFISTSQMELKKPGYSPQVEALLIGSLAVQAELKKDLERALNPRWIPRLLQEFKPRTRQLTQTAA